MGNNIKSCCAVDWKEKSCCAVDWKEKACCAEDQKEKEIAFAQNLRPLQNTKSSINGDRQILIPDFLNIASFSQDE